MFLGIYAMILHYFFSFLFPSPFLWIDIYRVFLEHRVKCIQILSTFCASFALFIFMKQIKVQPLFFGISALILSSPTI